ncbi:MAG: protein kinase [Acidobacteria bacterium]|nr:protein kinase [Acidobacteriota bacterium]
MDKDQWEKIEKIFYQAIELPDGDRKEFIQQACAGDEVLHREVQTLLESNRRTETFLYPPASVSQRPSGASSLRMKHCPKCGKIYPTLTRICQDDREILSLKDPYHLLGSTLVDKYKILALVGVGGMGAVYCAQHLGIDRRVALKILQPNLAIGNEYVMELFTREAKLAGRLTHENIVDVKDAGQTPDGIAYIAMEWLEGRTLDEELASQGRFDFQRAIGIIRQIAVALSVAHAERIIHRDLKPANIMLLDTPDGRDQVKVLDFGIGKILSETTANSPVSALVGTPQYACPEQLTVGGHVDGRSDIYSLGVIFYRLLGGELPFKCSSVSELLQLQLTGTPPSLLAIRSETPLEIDKLINRMMAKDPAERPQNASELSRLLDRILAEPKVAESVRTNVRAARLSPSELSQVSVAETRVFAAKPAWRGKLFLSSAVVLAIMIVAGIYGLYRYRSAQPVSEEPNSVAPTPAVSPSQSVPAVESTATPGSELVGGKGGFPSPTINQAQLLAKQQKAAELLKQAQALYKQGDYQNALRACDESLKLNPRLTEAHQLKQKITEILRILNNR